jgi:dihydrofolate synthase/folylpolyglutamate synthase
MALALTRPVSRASFERFLLHDLTRVTPLRGEPALRHARELVALLGDPQHHARQVHVVGTAGKGTTATLLTQLVVASGLTVGTHLSPHVYDVRERFLLDGALVAWDDLVAAADELYEAASTLIDRTGRPPTFFTATAALGWVLGRRADAHLLITEAGIGGRLDATNVIERTDKITVLTNVGLDHRELLGDEVGLVAAEKAAVIAAGGVVVVGPQSSPEVLDVVASVASERGARLVLVDQSLTDWRDAAGAVAAAAAAELGLASRSGWPSTFPPGRGERWHIDGRDVVVDGAHNPLKLTAMFEGLAADGDEPRRLAAVVAIGAGKDLAGCVDVIAAHVKRAVVTEFGDQGDVRAHPRSWPAAEVAERLTARGVDVSGVCRTPAEAVAVALATSSPGETLVVTGSFLHLAEIRHALIQRNAGAVRPGDQATPR